jgi:transposase
VRLRTRAQMVLLAEEHHLSVGAIAAIVRESEGTVRCWLKGSVAEGIEGLRRIVGGGAPVKVTQAYQDQWLQVVRRRPRSLGHPYSMWTDAAARGHAWPSKPGFGYKTKRCGCPSKPRRSCSSVPHHTISSPDPDSVVKKRRFVATRNGLKAGEVFYDADEFNLSWFPTLRAMWSPKGQQVMRPVTCPAHPAVWDRRGQPAYRRNRRAGEAPQAAPRDCGITPSARRQASDGDHLRCLGPCQHP